MKTLLFAAAGAAALLAGAPAHAFDGWHLESATTIPGKGSAWDYLTFDGAAGRLYIGHRKEGLQVFDVAQKRLIKVVDKTATQSSNGATLMPEFDLGISNNEDGSITPFKLSTLEAAEPIKLGDELDTSHYDASTKRIIVNVAAGKDGTELIVLEAPSLNRVGTIKVSTRKPEHAEADGHGLFYLAARDNERVYRIDTRSLQVTAEWPTPGCGQTNSLALDHANKRILLACRGNEQIKPSFAVMNAETGAIGFKAEIGGGNDGLVYDPELKRVFTANGVNAVMNIFEQVDADTYKPLEALGTLAGVRTLAYDARNKKLYSVTAEGAADYAKKITTTVSPWYANTFVADTFKVLVYSR